MAIAVGSIPDPQLGRGYLMRSSESNSPLSRVFHREGTWVFQDLVEPGTGKL